MFDAEKLRKLYQNAIDVLQILETEFRNRDISRNEIVEARNSLVRVSNDSDRLCRLMNIIVWMVDRQGFKAFDKAKSDLLADECALLIKVYEDHIERLGIDSTPYVTVRNMPFGGV